MLVENDFIQLRNTSSENLQTVYRTAGGFAWWYLDVCNDQGDGLVLIWGLGLPFVPGARALGAPSGHGSLMCGLTRAGKTMFYSLVEHHVEEDFAADGSAVIGQTAISVKETEGNLTLTANLEVPFGGANHLVGRVTLSGEKLRLPGPAVDKDGEEHVWSPRVLSGVARVELSDGSERYEFSGSGYFDGNHSAQSLFRQNIRSWTWARVSFGEHSAVIYHILGSSQSAQGKAEQLIFASGTGPELLIHQEARVDFQGRRVSPYGIVAPSEVFASSETGNCRIQLGARVEDGPFYQRYAVSAEMDGEAGRGFLEVLRPNRVDASFLRPLVRMRTYRTAGGNSVFAPLFLGPKAGRVRRFFSRRPVL